jgi:hypothetical protein
MYARADDSQKLETRIALLKQKGYLTERTKKKKKRAGTV